MKLLLRNGLIIDGSGSPGFRGDLLLENDRIVAVGHDLLANEDHTDLVIRDCTGLVIAPGFIDVHTHDDAIVLQKPAMLPKLSQGITTVIAGNCGISLLPLVTPAPQPPLNLLGHQSFRFERFAQYRDAFNEACPSINTALLIGHTTLRFAVMDTLNRAATAAELEKMAELLAQCLADGAIGLSSGLFYEPAFAAPAEEITTLARVVARYGGVYTSHLRSEMADIIDAMHEAADSAHAANVPLVISHHKCAGPTQWGRSVETLAIMERLAARQALAMDTYPYTAGSTVLREDLVDGVIDIRITWSDSHPDMAGRWLADIASEWQTSQQEACRRLQPGGACYFQMHEDDVQRIMAHPLTMIGSDGLPHDRHPHPRLWGTFPRVLGHYQRELKLFPLETAIHKMTGLSAAQFRLSQRGLLKPGYFADIVLLDPARVQDMASYDQPCLPAIGITAVYVNGELSYQEGKLYPLARAGRLLQRQDT